MSCPSCKSSLGCAVDCHNAPWNWDLPKTTALGFLKRLVRWDRGGWRFDDAGSRFDRPDPITGERSLPKFKLDPRPCLLDLSSLTWMR